MTNEEAISLIGGLAKKIDEYCELNSKGRTAFEMAISALKAQDLHNTCTEVAQDTVSRQDAISMVHMSLFPKIGLAKKVVGSLMQLPSVQPEVIRCKNCKHRPTPTENYNYDNSDCGFEIDFPDYRCPCQCDDEFYNRIPDDDWFCGNAERRTDE